MSTLCSYPSDSQNIIELVNLLSAKLECDFSNSPFVLLCRGKEDTETEVPFHIQHANGDLVISSNDTLSHIWCTDADHLMGGSCLV